MSTPAEFTSLETEEIVFLYADEDWPVQRIAEKFDVSCTTIFKVLRARGVVRSCGEVHNRLRYSVRAFEVAESLAVSNFYTTAEVAAIFGVRPLTVHKWVRAGKLKAKPVSFMGTRGYLFPVNVVNEIVGLFDD